MPKDIALRARLRRHFPADMLQRLARRVGYGERRRKCPPERLFVTLVLGFAAEASKTLAALQRFFCALTGTTITSSCFQRRFSNEAADFFAAALHELLGARERGVQRRLRGRLARFHEVVALDATLVRLSRHLARHFRGFASKGTEAMAKLHVVHNLSRRDIERVALTGGRVSEVKRVPTGAWMRGSLCLFDLGYYSHEIFRKIAHHKGLFLCKLKAHANPLVTALRAGRKTIPLQGVRLRKMRVDEDVVDVDAVFGSGRQRALWRVVGVRDPSSGTWRFYVTNLPTTLRPNELAQIYRLRWEVELLFRELKSSYRLGEVPSRKPATARCLLLAALISLLLGRVLMDLTALRHELHIRHISPRRFAAVLATNALDFGRALLDDRPRLLSAVLRRISDIAVIVARAARPRGGAVMLRP